MAALGGSSLARSSPQEQCGSVWPPTHWSAHGENIKRSSWAFCHRCLQLNQLSIAISCSVGSVALSLGCSRIPECPTLHPLPHRRTGRETLGGCQESQQPRQPSSCSSLALCHPKTEGTVATLLPRPCKSRGTLHHPWGRAPAPPSRGGFCQPAPPR